MNHKINLRLKEMDVFNVSNDQYAMLERKLKLMNQDIDSLIEKN